MKTVRLRGAGTLFWLGLFMATGLVQTTRADKTFTGAGNWSDGTLWTGGTKPADGDVVIIDGNVTNDEATAILTSYTLNASRINTFTGTNPGLRATNVVINGTITHPVNTDTNAPWEASNIVSIIAYSNLTLNAGGQITVNGKGYQGTTVDGCGPGRGLQYYGGGGYGGAGGHYIGGSQNAGQPYGVSTAPVEPGSSGGAHSLNNEGGNGGGAVVIQAVERVTINGTISANGDQGVGSYGAGGSGGGVYISCGTLDGAGIIQANGGRGATQLGAGGGGGRIAVVYTNLSAQGSLTPAVTFSATGGKVSDYTHDTDGTVGTLYLPTTNFFPPSSVMGGWRIMTPGFTSWSPASLTVSNGLIWFPDGFQLSVAGNVSFTNGGGMLLTNYASITCGNLLIGNYTSQVTVADHSDLTVSGNLIITNTGVLNVYGGLTNSGGSSGLLVTVSGSMSIGPSSAAYLTSHSTNGGSALIRVANLTVASGGQINADFRGFAGGVANTNRGLGYGPGAGLYDLSYTFCRCGASYGGMGGAGNVGTPGVTYGSSNAPVDAGSGGQGNVFGGNGGGLIRIEASRQVKVDGLLTANGGNGTGGYSGGGSGGGIYLRCKTFIGSGWIRAKGGASNESSYSGGGGGGRIAIWRQYDNWTGTNLNSSIVSGGNGWNSGTAGTVVLGWLQAAGTLVIVR